MANSTAWWLTPEYRALTFAQYIVENRATVRQCAQRFGVSHGLVHLDVVERLPRFDPELAARVREVLDQNKAERSGRGGRAAQARGRARH